MSSKASVKASFEGAKIVKCGVVDNESGKGSGKGSEMVRSLAK